MGCVEGGGLSVSVGENEERKTHLFFVCGGGGG